ncbi:uncharacterized protein LTR77_002826 [Saxophila tyrrhenica]|uniref:Uncharacterized protein n=1 Tax=Saxophila tyrrhenica TaxID=1690608 RepID=A0AAV9PG98_9PEZI|nr:hypothetical protein LTR77_002826 [Saxophila tyrrhenica]
MADSNPSNFANLPKETVKEIASMGGKASHGMNGTNGSDHAADKSHEGRNPDSTFTKGSDAASAAGHLGGLHAAGKEESGKEGNGRREDGTFLPGSEAAAKAGHKGGVAAATSDN